ncbi:hypothetical protein AB7849_14985 [Rhodanobacter sp. 115]|uniref:hypothetical protein n=1 Tax=Rhodanobacter sp. FW021-MT20 TaxID=1162282 RepID=UPI0034E4BABE
MSAGQSQKTRKIEGHVSHLMPLCAKTKPQLAATRSSSTACCCNAGSLVTKRGRSSKVQVGARSSSAACAARSAAACSGASAPISAAVEVLAFDPGLQRLYVASESGVVAVFRLEDWQLRLLGRSDLAYRTSSPSIRSSHRVYFTLQNVDGRSVLRIMAPTP